MSQMSRESQEALKNRIRSELAQARYPQNTIPTREMGYSQNIISTSKTGDSRYVDSSRQRGSLSQHANMATLNREEFHPDVMVVGSTGEYRDMQGGTHFEQYDCGHEYNDSVIRRNIIKENEITNGQELIAFLHDKEEVKKAVIVSDIIGRRGGMRRRKRF